MQQARGNQNVQYSDSIIRVICLMQIAIIFIWSNITAKISIVAVF
jgi:hypothetical protein